MSSVNPPKPLFPYSYICFEKLIVVESGLKKTFNDGIQSLMKELTSLQENVISQQSLLTTLTQQHATLKADLTTHRHETIQKIQDIAIKSPTSPPPISPHSLRPALKSFKLDLSALKTEHAQFESHFQASLQEALHSLPQVCVLTHDDLAMQKTELEGKTQALVTASDDLSDQVDDLRIDITQKRIRPHPRTITAVKKQNTIVAEQIAAVEAELKAMKPHWKRKWEEELQQVIDGQEFLRHQETLVADLRKDLSDTETVITQIIQAAELFESATPREWLSGAIGSGGRDALLGEVKTLQPNSAERIEAIKQAERQRLREMELRRENDFQLELGELVNEDKLRSQSEVAARLEAEREEKERWIRREMWDGRPGQQPNSRTSSASRGEKTSSPWPVEEGGKRAVSEGFNGTGRSSEEESVVRSQSHSSGLTSRGRPVSTVEGLHRASTESSRRSGGVR
jgi:Actin interacting protein 3